jgi:hypothetical protein
MTDLGSDRYTDRLSDRSPRSYVRTNVRTNRDRQPSVDILTFRNTRTRKPICRWCRSEALEATA